MVNNDLTNHESINNIDYTENRNIPYLAKPNDYYLTVNKFNLETANLLPVFIPIIKPNQPDVNKTVYEFQLEYNGNAMSVNVQYVPQDQTVQPNTNISSFDGSGLDKYYYVYSYQWFINMLNTTLKQLIDSFNATNALPSTVYPYFEFDTKTSLMTLNLPYQYYDASAATPIKLSCNNALSTLIATIMTIKKRDAANKKWHQFYPTSTITKTVNSQVYYTLNQESTSIGILNPVASIAFTTCAIPINPANSTPAVKFGSNAQNTGVSNNAGTSNVICEFSVPMSNGNTYANTVDYKPAFLNYIDMFGQNPLNRIQLSAQWKDKYGNYNNIELPSGCTCSISLSFIRRDFWNMNLQGFKP
jgi:hypothetical protein